jgi:hypothetical protein
LALSSSKHDQHALIKAHALLNAAELIVFLSFAFDPLNFGAVSPVPLNHNQQP